jgi:excisionase family DNA binding protein
MEKLLSIEELSEKLGIPVSTLYAWTCKKKIPYVKLGRLVRFRESEITEWIAKNSVHPDDGSCTPVPDRKRRKRSLRQGAEYVDRIVQTSKDAVLATRRGCDRM